ncbi:MAG: CmpA/NrtA family ABC transporter substrate-binding protein [Pseudanabaena sp.]|jgi:nitrate/nitrite transport system substrate-binding protein|nr:ABC transporter substrate-binding protein [Pseudanabaena sp. M110S1SP2A07QC]MCA6531716.1 ABC transporter substrate-binding protein [Pseudanabaena sp. M125S2SP2A07QC]MCA6534973.1 ABC transporter substrate-binding protein [Pseudanabaena sp. M176S2SP2A07QC]MCA6540227.1 ABC transporter substrate-binding protein [Pseudanabaena sp. M037S2SP2A07QC]MCA6549027.1 ABC transporter substrate-binding protein [Pseudanabaena sp. M152S2SP2A07QC]MCA6554652.1 ABC transporter substrate-binding protein [Pseudan
MSTTRRAFLQGMTATASAIAFSACSQEQGRNPTGLSETALAVEPVINPASLEKPNLTIGFVPVNDCAPFAIAWEKGFFRKYGLNVTLSREASWANSRDGIIFGRLDASPVVSGAVTNARIGAEGARQFPLCAVMTIHRHGNAITFNRKLWGDGIRPLSTYVGDLDRFGKDLRQYWQTAPIDDRVWATVLSSSIYEYFIRYLLAAAGINPVTELRSIITPPPQMVSNMRMDAIQAYMVAEPWNTRAIAGNEGVGFTFAQGREIWNGHPDRLLAVRESFIQEYPKTYRSLVKAMIEACRYCSEPANREEVAKIISQRSFTGANVKYTSPAIVGNYNYGGFDNQQRITNSLATTLFFEIPTSVSDVAHDHSTFLWQSQSLWLMTQAARWGQIPEFPKNAEAIARQGWRTDLYREIATEMGIVSPADDYKVEPASAFVDRQSFDPSNPIGYLNNFAIRANAPHSFFFA